MLGERSSLSGSATWTEQGCAKHCRHLVICYRNGRRSGPGFSIHREWPMHRPSHAWVDSNRLLDVRSVSPGAAGPRTVQAEAPDYRPQPRAQAAQVGQPPGYRSTTGLNESPQFADAGRGPTASLAGSAKVLSPLLCGEGGSVDWEQKTDKPPPLVEGAAHLRA